MKKLIAFLVMIVVFVTMATSSNWTYYQTGTDNNNIGYGYITNGVWKLYAKRLTANGTDLSVTGSGGAFYGDVPSPINLTHISDNQGVPYKVKTIGVVIGNTAGSLLYNYREMLTEVIAPDCTTLTGAQYSFFKCSALTNVVFNVDLSYLSDSKPFTECYQLEGFYPRRILLSAGVPYQCFTKCYRLGGKFEFPYCTSISSQAFGYCNMLEEVSAPNAKSIGEYAFQYCTALERLTVSPELVSVSHAAFQGCTSLEPDFLSNVLGRSLRYIGLSDFSKMQYEFQGCTTLTSLVWDFPNLATNVVNASCFSGCSSLEKVLFKTPVVEIRGSAFYGIKPGAEVYVHKEAPVVFGSVAIGRLADGTAYPRVYLKGNETQWLDVIRKNNHVIRKEDFDNTGFASTNQVACVHDERTWQVFATQMAKDTEVCDHETTGGIVSRVWMKKKGVIAFVLYHSGSNHQESGFWVFRAPQNGFSVIVR